MAMPAERNILPNVGGWKVFFGIDDGSRENGIRKWIGEIHFLLYVFFEWRIELFLWGYVQHNPFSLKTRTQYQIEK